MEEALAHSEETYRTIMEQMYDFYYEVDLAGNFTFVNDSVCHNLGYSKEGWGRATALPPRRMMLSRYCRLSIRYSVRDFPISDSPTE